MNAVDFVVTYWLDPNLLYLASPSRMARDSWV